MIILLQFIIVITILFGIKLPNNFALSKNIINGSMIWLVGIFVVAAATLILPIKTLKRLVLWGDGIQRLLIQSFGIIYLLFECLLFHTLLLNLNEFIFLYCISFSHVLWFILLDCHQLLLFLKYIFGWINLLRWFIA